MDRIEYKRRHQTEETYTGRYKPADLVDLLPDWIMDLKKYFGQKAKREYSS